MPDQPVFTVEAPHRMEVGDIVAYTQAFLDRHGHFSTDMPVAQGKVKALHRLPSGAFLADIAWDKPGLPKRVNVKNLTRA